MLKLAVFTITLSLMFKANKNCLFSSGRLANFLQSKRATSRPRECGLWSPTAIGHMRVGEREQPAEQPAPQFSNFTHVLMITTGSDEIDSQRRQSELEGGVASADGPIVLCRK